MSGCLLCKEGCLYCRDSAAMAVQLANEWLIDTYLDTTGPGSWADVIDAIDAKLEEVTERVRKGEGSGIDWESSLLTYQQMRHDVLVLQRSGVKVPAVDNEGVHL